MKNKAKVAVDGGRNEMVEPSERVARDEHRSEAICLGEGTQEQQTKKSIGSEVTTEEIMKRVRQRTLVEAQKKC